MCHLVKNDSACPRCHEHFYIRLVHCKLAKGEGEDKIWGTCPFFEYAFPEVFCVQCAVTFPQDPEALWRLDPKVQEPLGSKAVIRALDVGPKLCNICMGIERGELPGDGREDDMETLGPDPNTPDEDDQHHTAEIFDDFPGKDETNTPGFSPPVLDQPQKAKKQKKRKPRKKKTKKSQAVLELTESPAETSPVPITQPQEELRAATTAGPAQDAETAKEEVGTDVVEPPTPLEPTPLEDTPEISLKPKESTGGEQILDPALLKHPSYRHASTQWYDETSEEEGSLTPTTRVQEHVPIDMISAQVVADKINAGLGCLESQSFEPVGSEISSFASQFGSSEAQSLKSSATLTDDSSLVFATPLADYQSWSEMVEEDLAVNASSLFQQDLRLLSGISESYEIEAERQISTPFQDDCLVMTRAGLAIDKTDEGLPQSTSSEKIDPVTVTESELDEANDGNLPLASPVSTYFGSAGDEGSIIWAESEDHVYDISELDEREGWTIVHRRKKKWKHWRPKHPKSKLGKAQETEWDC